MTLQSCCFYQYFLCIFTKMDGFYVLVSIDKIRLIFFSRLAKRGGSLLSCASDFLPITVFVSIRRINQFIFTNVYFPLFKYFSFALNTNVYFPLFKYFSFALNTLRCWIFQNNSESLIKEEQTNEAQFAYGYICLLLEKHVQNIS